MQVPIKKNAIELDMMAVCLSVLLCLSLIWPSVLSKELNV